LGARPRAILHVDLDGAADIYYAHGWEYPPGPDPLFESGLRHTLDFLDANDVRATLFAIAGALDDPAKLDLVREAVRRGHEIASHSATHASLPRLTSDQKRREILESRERIERILGVAVRGFRAPGYALDRECLELLDEAGYRYDSSAFPTPAVARQLGVPLASLAAPHRPLAGRALIELPLPDYRPSPFPFSPSYALLFGSRYFRWGVDRHRRGGQPMALLFHLNDLSDPLPPHLLRGFPSRLFTLSLMSAQAKRERCQRMLDLVTQHYDIVATADLLREIGG
jgi:peptidoglycan/xylan/chitin deacetylase (PgdA/CDA1 family)